MENVFVVSFRTSKNGSRSVVRVYRDYNEAVRYCRVMNSDWFELGREYFIELFKVS